MKANYRFLSFFYDLIDVFYFNRKEHSPRTALINLLPDKPVRVLDVCAGTGSNSIEIGKHKAQAQITALDLSAEMLKIADDKFRKTNLKNIEIVVADACDTNFADNSFDVILLSLVLHEVTEELRKAILAEAKRILSNNGKLIVIEWEQPQRRFQRLIFFPIKLMEPKGFKKFLRIDLPGYFQEFGFTVLEEQRCDYTRVFILGKCVEHGN